MDDNGNQKQKLEEYHIMLNAVKNLILESCEGQSVHHNISGHSTCV